MAVLTGTALHCPRDQSALRSVLFNRGALHLCEQCHGSFVPGKIVRDVPRIARWFAAQTDGVESLPEGELNCPEGHGLMHELRLDKHHLDLCGHCNGIWFDADELKRIDQKAAMTDSAKGEASEVAADVIDAVTDDSSLLEGALDLLGDIVSGIDISF